MSVVAKILVVINLVLAIVFLAVSATYLGEKETWRIRHDQIDKQHKQTISNLEATLAQTTVDRDEARAKAGSIERLYETDKATFAAKESEYTRLTEEHNRLLGQYERLAQTASDLQTTIDQLNNDKNRLVQEKDDALGEKREALSAQNDAEAEQRRLSAEIQGLNDQIVGLNKQLNETGEELDKTSLELAAYKTQYPDLGETLAPPKIKGAVAGVDASLNIVLLSVGGDDGVQKGHQFTIFRGNEYVGVVIIDSVERDHASGYSKKELEKSEIQVGDQATTRF